jgi:hypothetical protein
MFGCARSELATDAAERDGGEQHREQYPRDDLVVRIMLTPTIVPAPP